MTPKCFFCDTDLDIVAHTFRMGNREEAVCEECHLKTVNRKKAQESERSG